jgi:hypothetical protein
MKLDKMKTLIAFLKNLDKSKFDINHIISQYDYKNQCGTVCCAIGWFPAIFPEECQWYESELFIHGKSKIFSKIAHDVLGIPERHADVLFSPFDIVKSHDHCMKVSMPYITLCDYRSTPLEVAEMLERYVEGMEYVNENLPTMDMD